MAGPIPNLISPTRSSRESDVELLELLDEEATRAMERPGGLRLYVPDAWPRFEPATDFETNWHIDAICDHLEAVTMGHIRFLLITMPPRHLKSSIVIVSWPTWSWGPAHNRKLWKKGGPGTKWIFSSYAASLSNRDSRKRRQIMDSPWYRERWGRVFSMGKSRFKTDGQVKYENDFSGYHLSTSVGGSNTGEGGNFIVFDDPHNMREIHSETIRTGVVTWWDEVMTTRLNDPRSDCFIGIMQRGHQVDLAGHVLEKSKLARAAGLANAEWTHLNLPTEFEPKFRCRVFLPAQLPALRRYEEAVKANPDLDPDDPSTPTPPAPFFEDPRARNGELLFPARFGPDSVAKAKLDLGSYGYAAQHQQRPSPLEGGILKKFWWRFWVPNGHELAGRIDILTHDRIAEWHGDKPGFPILALPMSFAQRVNSWDCAFEDADESDYVVGGAWGKTGALSFLLHQRRGQWSFTETCEQVRDMHKHWPATITLVERRANGHAVLNSLGGKISGLIPYVPTESKESRVHAVSPVVEAGQVILPHPAIAPWVLDYVDELAAFPNAANDDQVDQTTQALIRLTQGKVFDESRVHHSD